MKRLVAIVNPNSRPSRVRKCLDAVKTVLSREGWDVEVFLTERAGDPARIAAAASKDASRFLVAGGDGTVCEVVGVLENKKTPVGIVPMGTVNVLARELGIPMDPLAAVEAFAGGAPRDFDLGFLGERHFLLMASYGFDAFAVRRTSLKVKKVLGRTAYLLSALVSLPFFHPEPIEVFPPQGDKSIKATFALFANARRYGGGSIAAPAADMTDGLLDVLCWTKRGRAGAILGVASLFVGKFSENPATRSFRTPTLRFRTKKTSWFQIDGDPADGSRGQVFLKAGAFSLVVPRP